MADNKESFQESVMIRRAKRRLFGAVIILIILFIVSIFFFKIELISNLKNPIKISFLEKNNEIMIDINILILKIYHKHNQEDKANS